MNEISANRWLECMVAEQRYALRVDGILELVDPTSRTMMTPPGMPPLFVGVMDLRSSLVPILDLRLEMGMPTMHDETNAVIEMFEQRERDHVNWINELDSSVRQEREFKLATDPHQCAFGKWFDQLMADEDELHRFTNGNLALTQALRSFGEPHQRIHAISIEVSRLVALGQIEEALALIEQTRSTVLGSMVKLFEHTRTLVRQLRKSLIIVLECDDDLLGVVVDGVQTVREIDREEICPPPEETGQAGLVIGITTMQDGAGCEQLIQLLDASMLFRKHHVAAASADAANRLAPAPA